MQIADLPRITLHDSPRERGHRYGEQLRGRVQDTVAKYKDALAADHGEDPDLLVDRLRGATRFEQAMERKSPHIIEEIQAIAEGADLPYGDVLALNLLDEMDWFAADMKAGSDRARVPGKCSAAAMRSDDGGPTIAGQNMDIGAWCEGSQVLLRIVGSDAGPEQLLFSIAGSLGLNGMNARGLGVCLNALPMLASGLDGLPVTCILRCLLRQKDLVSAIAFLQSVEHASGQNYLLCAPGGIASIECSAHTTTQIAYRNVRDRVIHTNHPLANGDTPAGNASTLARYVALDGRMKGPDVRPSVELFQALLRSKDDPAHPVCRSHDEDGRSAGYTIGSSIYEVPVNGPSPRLHVCPGPPDSGEYGVFSFGQSGPSAHDGPGSAGTSFHG